jgi:multicomponent Na+:H+ antiporter subunit F
MSEPHLVVALVLLAAVIFGLILLFAGSGRVERLLALQLLGTTLVAVVMLLAGALQMPRLFDLALVLGLLAPAVAVAFVHYGRVTPKSGDREA